MTRLRVLFAPLFQDNPYQRLLIQALARHDVEVEGVLALGTGTKWPTYHRELVRFRPDVLHLHWLHPYFRARTTPLAVLRVPSFLRPLRWARRSGVPLVYTVHNLLNHERTHPALDRWLTRRVIRQASWLIVQGASARPLVLDYARAGDPARMTDVPLGNYIDYYPHDVSRAAARHRLGLPEDAFVFVHVGRIRPYKGAADLARTFAGSELRDRSHLFIAGMTRERRLRIALKRRRRKVPSLHFELGFVPDEDLQLYHAAADVIVLPYREILSSSATVLAMSFGKPVIAPRLGCIPDTVDEQGAILYDPGTPGSPESRAALDRAMHRAFDERGRLAEMGRHNLERARGFDWDEIARAHREVYDRVLRDR